MTSLPLISMHGCRLMFGGRTARHSMQSLYTLARSLSSSLIPSFSLLFSLGYTMSVTDHPAGMDCVFGTIVFSVIFCLPQEQLAWGEGRNGCCGGAGAADGADVARPRVKRSPLTLKRGCQ